MSSDSSNVPKTAGTLRLIACLCAEWCGTCRDWRAMFDDVAARHPDAHVVWLDIEDESDLMGDMEVETFPTLLIAEREAGAEGPLSVRFFGPLAPHAQTFARLLDSINAPDGPTAKADPEVEALAERLYQHD